MFEKLITQRKKVAPCAVFVERCSQVSHVDLCCYKSDKDTSPGEYQKPVEEARREDTYKESVVLFIPLICAT